MSIDLRVLVDALRCYVHSQRKRFRARLYLSDIYGRFGILYSTDLEHFALRECVSVCGDIFGMKYVYDENILIEFIPPTRGTMVLGDTLDDVLKYIKCVGMCISNKAYGRKLTEYMMYTNIEPVLLEVLYDEYGDLRMYMAISPGMDSRASLVRALRKLSGAVIE